MPVCVCVCVCVCEKYFLYPSVSEHLGYFHILAMVSNTVRNIYLFELVFLFALGKYPEMDMLDHMVGLLLNFFEELHTVLHSGCTNLQPPSSVLGFPFSHILIRTYFLPF